MQKKVETVRSLLIQIANGDILVPSAVVAEIIGYKLPQALDNQPEWMLGAIEWRNQKVPIVDIKHLLALPAKADTTLDEKTFRLVILYGLESVQMMPFFGFIAASVPRVLSVAESSLQNPIPEKSKGLVFQVSVLENQTAWLPDLNYVENLVRKSPVLAQLKM